MDQLIGESFLRSLNEAQQYKNRRAQERVTNERANLLPKEFDMRNALNQERIKQIQAHIQSLNDMRNYRMAQMLEGVREFNVNQQNNNRNFEERKREFDISQQTDQDRINSLSNRGVVTQTLNAAKNIADKYNAIGADGKVDLNKIPPFERQMFMAEMNSALKSSGYAAALKRLLNFRNASDALSNLDVDALKHYSGIMGYARNKKDELFKPKIYERFITAKSNLEYIKDQLTQAFGTSISTEQGKEMMNAIATIGRTGDANIIESQINLLWKILRQEQSNAQASITNPGYYFGVGNAGASPTPFIGAPMKPVSERIPENDSQGSSSISSKISGY